MDKIRFNDIGEQLEDLYKKREELVEEASKIFNARVGEKIEYYKTAKMLDIAIGYITRVSNDGRLIWVQRDGDDSKRANRIIRIGWDIGEFRKIEEDS